MAAHRLWTVGAVLQFGAQFWIRRVLALLGQLLPADAIYAGGAAACVAKHCVQGFGQPGFTAYQMIQVCKPVFRLGLRFSGETLLRLAEIILHLQDAP